MARKGGDVRTNPGGDADRIVDLDEWGKSTNPNMLLHVTPSTPMAKEFPWWNKPFSVRHWMENTDPQEKTIILIDPDQFFLAPISQMGSKAEDIIVSKELRYLTGTPELDNMDVVRKGHPVAQFYGLGDGWVRSKFNREIICGADSHCAKVTSEEAWKHYSIGPPYMLENSDFRKVATTWLDFMMPVYEQDKGDIQADMYAYNMAAAHHNLPHTRLDHYMISANDAFGEGWKWIDENLEKVGSLSCGDPHFPSHMHVPTFLHAARHYKAYYHGTLWNFHKGHVPTQILDCRQPLIVRPPDDFIDVQDTKHSKREAFMICTLTDVINRAVFDYREQFCPLGFNAHECVRIVEKHPKQGRQNPHKYPLAELACDEKGDMF